MAIVRRFVFAAALGGLVGLVVSMIAAPRFLGWFQAPGVGGALCDCVAIAQSTALSMVKLELSAALGSGILFVGVASAFTWWRRRNGPPGPPTASTTEPRPSLLGANSDLR